MSVWTGKHVNVLKTILLQHNWRPALIKGELHAAVACILLMIWKEWHISSRAWRKLMVCFLSCPQWWCWQDRPLLKVKKEELKKRVENCLTKHPAQSQTLTNGKKNSADSGRGVVIKEVEDVNSSLNKTNLDETQHVALNTTCFLNCEFVFLLLLRLTSVTSSSSMRKADAQTTRTKISCLIGLWNHFGNMSLTVVIKLSTSTNWWQSQSVLLATERHLI